MDLEFASIELQKLFTDSQGAEKYKESAYKGFLVVTTLMLNAVTLKDLSIFRRKNFEELKGARRGEYSLRLDQQYGSSSGLIQIELPLSS